MSDIDYFLGNDDVYNCHLNAIHETIIPEVKNSISEIEQEFQKTLPDLKQVGNNTLLKRTLTSCQVFSFLRLNGAIYTRFS